ICVGRDPRDVMVSWENHMANVDFERLLTARMNAVGLDDLDMNQMPTPPPEDPVERFWAWADEEAAAGAHRQAGLARVPTPRSPARGAPLVATELAPWAQRGWLAEGRRSAATRSSWPTARGGTASSCATATSSSTRR